MSSDLVRTDDPGPGGDEETTAQAVVDAVLPLLRGRLHQVCFFLSFPAGLFVVANAGSPRARVAAIVYAIGLSTLFAVSATYHRRVWSPAARSRMKRLDHGTIFVMIAANYTPLCLLALDGSLGGRILLAVWLAAAAGFILALVGIAEKAVVGLVIYIGLGWFILLALPELTRKLSTVDLSLLLVGGLLYTVGCIFMGTRWPDPYPAIFGYHEVWHVMVVAAAACHYVVILTVVRTAA
ncbi:MAG TPA: hemolysin III family protein [Acidimicrobiales bacterium]|nr:hemolysin III family protein [Acidimicrobiales bacterium]